MVHPKSTAPPLPAASTLRQIESALEELVTLGLAPLPPYPAVALAVQAELARKGFALSDAARLLGADPVLAVSVLRCANSAVYRGSAPVTGLTTAIARIGTRQLTRILFASCLSVHAHAPGPLAALRRLSWTGSVASAAICQELAVLRQLRAEEGFLLGLLHDFGRVVTCAALELLVAQRRVDGRWPLAEWGALVERHHQALGVRTARSWGLPALFAEVIGGHHHDPQDPAAAQACEDPGLLEVVRLSDRVVALLDAPPRAGSELLPPGLLPEAERRPVARVLEGLPELIDAFEPEGAARPAAPSPVVEPALELGPGQRPVRHPLTVKLADGEQSWAAATIAEEGLVMSGPEGLPEGQLLRLTLEAAPQPFTLWTLVGTCRRTAGTTRVEVRPFSLGGPARERWLQLVQGA